MVSCSFHRLFGPDLHPDENLQRRLQYWRLHHEPVEYRNEIMPVWHLYMYSR